MKYLSNGIPSTPEHIDKVLKRVIERDAQLKTMGTYIAELKTTGEFIGWFSLKPLPGTSEIEVGYRLLKKHWGFGYATEGAKMLIDYGFKTLGLKKIIAITHPLNKGSQNVLKKSGLKYVGDSDYRFSVEEELEMVSWFEIVGT
jgi:RimJ/RimL family protein N-acetyltransferase